MGKTVKITITGTVDACEYCSESLFNNYDNPEEAFNSEFYITSGWNSIEGIYMNDDRENNLVKKKGKYVKVVNYFHDLFSTNSDHPLPVELHVRTFTGDNEIDYYIDLKDDEEFDIKKVQLVKSDYEIEAFPYYILTEKILYDGKEIPADDEMADYFIEGRYHDKYRVTDYINGGPQR